MESPITGKPMKLMAEKRPLSFRKEEFTLHYHYYLCEDTGEEFTTTQLDELNLTQLYNLYREKHRLPFPEEIKATREKYGLSASKMSEILGFGINSYRNYEAGEIPSLANAKLIYMAADPGKFRDLVDINDSLEKKNKEKILHRIDRLLAEEEEGGFEVEFKAYLMGSSNPSQFTGFKHPDFHRLVQIVAFFSTQLAPYKTMMNKLLFYADFTCYKRTGYSISGMQYRAIPLGPVPVRYDILFGYLEEDQRVVIHRKAFAKGIGEQFYPKEEHPFNSSCFSKIELQVLKDVVNQFKKCSTQEIIGLSHQEKAWIDNHEVGGLISYQEFAFDLKN